MVEKVSTASASVGQLQSADGTVIYTHSWPEEAGQLRCILYFIHGLGEHIKRYDGLFRQFNAHGIRVHGFDQRGHGETPNLNKGPMVRGHIGNLGKTVEDVNVVLRIDSDTSVPHFLMGHSMGGLVTIYYGLDETKTAGLAGVIASAPALDIGTPISSLKLVAGRLASKICPSMTIENGLDINNLSRIEAEIQRFLDDKLCHRKVSLQTAASILDMGETIREKGKDCSVAVPLLVTHGSADVMTSHEASRQFVENVTCPDKTFKSYTDAYHGLHCDLIREEVVNDYIEWILARCD